MKGGKRKQKSGYTKLRPGGKHLREISKEAAQNDRSVSSISCLRPINKTTEIKQVMELTAAEHGPEQV